MANTRPAHERERLKRQRNLSAIGDLDLRHNLLPQMVTLLTEVLTIYRTDGCDRVRLYVRRLDDKIKED